MQLAVFNEPELQALALKHRPELMATNASIDQARAEKKLQTGVITSDRSIAWPRRHSRKSAACPEWLKLHKSVCRFLIPVELAVHWQTRRSHRRQYQAEATRRLIPLEVERALATLIANTKALEHADHHVRQQQQLETLALRNYQQGNGDYMNLAEAKRLRLASQMEQLQAQQMLRVAYVDLERATGVAMQNLSVAP